MRPKPKQGAYSVSSADGETFVPSRNTGICKAISIATRWQLAGMAPDELVSIYIRDGLDRVVARADVYPALVEVYTYDLKGK